MSLQVWLPLNGDLHNQGLNNMTLINNTANIDNNGKIGKCYNFSSGESLTYNLDISKFNSTAFSFSCWIYISSWNSSYDAILSIANGTGWNSSRATLSRNNTASTLTWNIANGSTSQRISSNTNISLNTWTHIATTYDGIKLRIYINGILDKEGAADLSINYVSNFYLGTWNGGTSYPFNGKLNDVRIYNHCLSSKEVEEISKGLILHYQLNNNGLGNPNLVKGNYTAITTATTNNISGTLSFDTSIIALNDLKGKTLYFSYDYSVEGAKLYNNTGDYTKDRYGIHGSLSYVDSSGTTKIVYPFAGYLTVSGTGCAVQSYTIPADAEQINSLTFGLQPFNKPAANSTATWYIKNCKLEIGQATSYTPNQNDIHQDSSIIYDSSGYNNNGQIIGLLETTVPSPRYNCSTYIPTTSSKIHISNFLTSGFSNSYSFAWWGKRDSNNPMFWGFSNGIRLNGMYLGNLWNTGDGSNNPLYKIGTTTQVSAPSVNVWHHYVMVGNGSKCYVYLDGELWAEAKTYKAISGTSIYINGWDTGTSYCSNNTDILEFRIYATALTEAQVKELYRISMNINGTSIIPRDLE